MKVCPLLHLSTAVTQAVHTLSGAVMMLSPHATKEDLEAAEKVMTDYLGTHPQLCKGSDCAMWIGSPGRHGECGYGGGSPFRDPAPETN